MTTPTTNTITVLVQQLLPKSWYPRAKTVVAALLSLASAVLLVLPYFTGVPEQVGGIVGAVVAVLTPLGVYLTGNEDAPADGKHETNSPNATSVEETADKARYGTP